MDFIKIAPFYLIPGTYVYKSSNETVLSIILDQTFNTTFIPINKSVIDLTGAGIKPIAIK